MSTIVLERSGELFTLTENSDGSTSISTYSLKCDYSQGGKGGSEFCDKLVKRTYPEFFEMNINELMSCLQGQAIPETTGNTGIESWSGTVKFWSTALTSGAKVEIEYALNFPDKSGPDHLRITVSR